MSSPPSPTTSSHRQYETADRKQWLGQKVMRSVRSIFSAQPTRIEKLNAPNTTPLEQSPSTSVSLSLESEIDGDNVTPTMGLTRAIWIVFQVAFVIFLVSMSSGVIAIALPDIAADLKLPDSLYLWPTSVLGLTTGSVLLIAGTVTDVIGVKPIELVAVTLLGIFTLACGLSSNGTQLVLFRALQGIAMALHMPCSVSLVAKYVPSGKIRNVSFASLGFSMPLGFSVGLVLGGVFVEVANWRVGFYISGGIMLLQAILGFILIPMESIPRGVWKKLMNIDWVGAMIASAGLAMLSYTLGVISANHNNAKLPSSITLLVMSICLLISFPFWINWQEQKGRTALIPNSLWKSIPFSTICILTMFAWAFTGAMELFTSLYFQEVQEVSAFQASLQLLPNLLMGVIVNLTTGYIIDQASPFWLVLSSVLLTSVSSLLMALINPSWSYWKGAFIAQCLGPLACEIVSTVGLIVVSESFPKETQALAGAVYNTVAWFGLSFGLNIMQVVSLLVAERERDSFKTSKEATLQGYQAAFWTMFATMGLSAFLCVAGLRRMGQVGQKKE